jgi:cobalt-zinc-cadmium efflux system membrane fusion protein
MTERFRDRKVAVLCGLAAGAAMLAGCHAPERTEEMPQAQATQEQVVFPTNSPQLAALTVQPVSAQAAGSVPLAGRLVWDEDATVRVFTPFAGSVRKILAQVNQHVTKGEPLAEILSADFGQATAEARKAESDFRRTKATLERVRALQEHGAAPVKDVESAQADFESASAEKDRTSARLAIYATTEARSGNGFLLPSPLEGTVVEKNVSPGQEVRPDQMLANMPQYTAPLFVVTDPTRLWIQIDVTEAELSHFRPGCEITFTARAFGGEKFTGKVMTVSEFLDPTTRTIKVRGSVDNSRRLLKAEMFVSVNLPQQEALAASVPANAVFLRGEKHYVFLEDQPGEFRRKEVTIGSEYDGQIPILAGLQPGQRVVTDGCLLLQQILK